jgi:cystathionine beta-lyase
VALPDLLLPRAVLRVGPSGAMTHPYDAITLAELRERRSAKWQVHGPDVLAAWIAEMDFPLAEPVRAALLDAVGRSDTGYVHPGRLAEAYAGFASRRWGLAVDPGLVRVVPDVMRGIAAAVEAVSRPGDGIVVDTPAYPPFLHVLPDTGRRVVQVPLVRGDDGGFALDLDGIERAYADGARVHLLCSPHNPTGLVLARPTLEAVAELADRYGVTVIADEVHAPLTYREATHVPFASLDAPAARRSLSLASASKAWNVAGLKCALLVGAADSADVVTGLHEEVGFGASLLGVLANTAAYDAGEAWLDDTVSYLDGNRAALAELLAEQLPQVCWVRPSATYLAWLDCTRLGLGDDPAAVFLSRGRVALSPGPDFGAPGLGWARLNFATPRPLLADVVRRLADALGGR